MQSRRHFIQGSAAAALALPLPSFAQSRAFEPKPGAWRTFEVTTRVEVLQPRGVTRVWLPVPSIDSDWQQSQESAFTSNGSAKMTADTHNGARMVYAEFDAGEPAPWVQVTSRVQ